MSDFVNHFQGRVSSWARLTGRRPDVVYDLLPGAAQLDRSSPAPLGHVTFGNNMRMHLDVQVRDIEVLVIQLARLGAPRVSRDVDAEHRSHRIAGAGPEGNEFCSVMVAEAA